MTSQQSRSLSSSKLDDIDVGQRNARRIRRRSRAMHIAQLVGFGVVVVLIWQLLNSFGLISKYVLPSPASTAGEIGAVLANLVSGGYVLHALINTLLEVLAGFAFAGGIGIILGIIVGETRFGGRVLMPYIVALNAVPRIALAPVFVAWLGFGLEPKILLATLIAIFPVIINTALGMQSCSTNELLLFNSMEARRLQVISLLKFPTALPHIFAGLKTAITMCVTGAIVAEFLGGGSTGVGELINASAEQLDIASVFAYIILLSAVGLVLYGVIVLVERKVVHWRSTSATRAGR